MALKARQVWSTTFFGIEDLDRVLTNAAFNCHIIAQDKGTVRKIFDKIIKRAFDGLPREFKNMYDVKADNANELSVKLKWAPDHTWSTISVWVWWRWTTLQRLHITEFWKTCAKFKDKAEEIVTWAINSVWINQELIIESTAEWNEWYFYEICKNAESLRNAANPVEWDYSWLSALDFSYHFFARYEEEKYVLDDPNVVITKERDAYFDKISIENDVTITVPQRKRYIKKEEVVQDRMKREYPSSSKEAFEVAVEWSYYGTELEVCRKQQRVCKVPYDPTLKVNTCRDLWWAGWWDDMVVRYFQVYWKQVNWIDRDVFNWVGIVDARETTVSKKWYTYWYHFGPHDIRHTIQVRAKSRRQAAYEAWLLFTVVPTYSWAVSDRISSTKRVLKNSWFDTEKCTEWFNQLGMYKKKRNKTLGMFLNEPEHDKASHNADAFGHWCVMVETVFFKMSEQDPNESQIITPNHNLVGK